MELVARYLNGAMLVRTPRFADARGTFAVPYGVDAAAALGLPERFVQDNHSVSVASGTVRGLHLQLPPHAQGKLIRVLRGSIVDVIVDLRPGSPFRGHHERIELDAATDLQLWVPPGFGHGFATLEADTEVLYKVDADYRPEAERTLAWDDPALDIDWPIEAGSAVLSDKDAAGGSLSEILAEIDAAVGVAVVTLGRR